MSLVSALAVSASSAAGGVRVINPGVPIDDFFSSFVLPQLQQPPPSADIGPQIMLADCLKFASTFRQSLPAAALLPLFAQHLASASSHVVQVYAANAIEKYLLLGGSATAALDAQLYQTVLAGCLRVLLQGETREQQEDLYAMRCLLRLVLATPDRSIVTANAEQLVSGLLTKLSAVAANPSNPGFTHYLFECLAATVSALTTANKESAGVLEAGLFPHFQSILSNDVVELVPYSFQVLAMLLECNESVSPAYASLLAPLLTPDLWSRDYNVPALVRLVGAYCRTDPSLMTPHVESLLGIFAQLIKSKKTDHEGFLLLESMVSQLPWSSFEGYLSQLFSIIFARLTAAKTAKFVKSFVIFLALLLGKHEADAVVAKIDALQANMFGMVLTSCWLPNVNKVRGKIERKMLAIGSIRLLTQCPSILSQYGDTWLALLNALVALFELPAAKEDEGEAAADAAAEAILARLADDNDGTSYTPTFNKLRCAVAASVDPFAEVDGSTLPSLLARQLASFGSAGQVGPALRQLPAEVQQALSRYFQQAGVAMPQ
jgi:exportin-2 (importin alpha re-exporter)